MGFSSALTLRQKGAHTSTEAMGSSILRRQLVIFKRNVEANMGWDRSAALVLGVALSGLGGAGLVAAPHEGEALPEYVSRELIAQTSGSAPLPQTPKKCEYTVKWTEIEVTERQTSGGDGAGGAGEALEISAKMKVNEPWTSNSITWGHQTEGTKLEEDDAAAVNKVFPPEKTSVKAGTSVTVELYGKVTEHDSGANGEDDWGEGTFSTTFTCSGTSSKVLSKTISLTHNGNGSGKVKVTAQVKWETPN